LEVRWLPAASHCMRYGPEARLSRGDREEINITLKVLTGGICWSTMMFFLFCEIFYK